MFETFKVQRFTLINSATLSLFSTGTTTGLVAECGEGTTFTVPVFEGMALNHAMHRLDVSGLTVTEKLMDELIACDVKLDREQHLELVRNMKEQMCAVSYDYEGDLQQRQDPLSVEDRSYELPGGEIIEVNSTLSDNPAMVNDDPQGDAWFFKMKASDPSQMDEFMDEAAYQKFIG